MKKFLLLSLLSIAFANYADTSETHYISSGVCISKDEYTKLKLAQYRMSKVGRVIKLRSEIQEAQLADFDITTLIKFFVELEKDLVEAKSIDEIDELYTHAKEIFEGTRYAKRVARLENDL